MSAGQTERYRRSAPLAIWLAVGAASVVLAAAACGGDGDDAGGFATVVRFTPVPTMVIPGAAERVTVGGALMLDGAPLEAEFLGARVIQNGLATACQNMIPRVTQGGYQITVASDAEVRGCGAPGAEVVLWAFVNDTFVFSNETLPWPGGGASATFDASFASTMPEGASKPVTEFKGRLLDSDGSELPSGTVIEAFVGDVLCGVASLRYGVEVERLYTLIVAGPEAISGCAEDAEITFRLDGAPAAETAVNDLGRGSEGHELNLSLR